MDPFHGDVDVRRPLMAEGAVPLTHPAHLRLLGDQRTAEGKPQAARMDFVWDKTAVHVPIAPL